MDTRTIRAMSALPLDVRMRILQAVFTESAQEQEQVAHMHTEARWLQGHAAGYAAACRNIAAMIEQALAEHTI